MSTANPNPPNANSRPALSDTAVIDAIAWRLARSPDWSADELTDIADLIGTVRPHPGDLDHDTTDRAAQLDRYHHRLTHPSERNPA